MQRCGIHVSFVRTAYFDMRWPRSCQNHSSRPCITCVCHYVDNKVCKKVFVIIRCGIVAVLAVVPRKLLYETGEAVAATTVSTVGTPGIVLKRLHACPCAGPKIYLTIHNRNQVAEILCMRKPELSDVNKPSIFAFVRQLVLNTGAVGLGIGWKALPLQPGYQLSAQPEGNVNNACDISTYIYICVHIYIHIT